LGNIIEILMSNELEKYNKKLKRAKNNLDKLKNTIDVKNNMYKGGKINKNALKSIIQPLESRAFKKGRK